MESIKVQKILARIVPFGLAAYFLYFAIPALRAGFAADDPMNLGFYWIRGFWGDIVDILRFWSTAYRPMGALFYLPIYHFAGLNPLPYRVLALALIAANIFFSWRIAALLTGSPAAAALTALLVTAHASMAAIYYNTSMLYDIMTCFFLELMLCCYISFRRRGAPLAIWQAALVTVAFIAALDSKELAVVGAGWVLAYEMLFHRPWRLRLPIFLCLIAIVYTLGKFLGPHPLAQQEGYLLQLTPHRYFLNNRLYLNDIFYSQFFSTSRRVVFAWLALTAVCWLARRSELWWCWVLVSTATLGISFTIQPRGASGLYLPLFAWALLVGILTTTFLNKRVALAWIVVALVAWFWIPKTVGYWRRQPQLYVDSHRLTGSVIAQMSAIRPKPAPNSRVIVLQNPFADYDVEFIAMLLWNDHSIQTDLANKLPQPPDLQTYNWVLTFEGEQLRVLKRPD